MRQAWISRLTKSQRTAIPPEWSEFSTNTLPSDISYLTNLGLSGCACSFTGQQLLHISYIADILYILTFILCLLKLFKDKAAFCQDQSRGHWIIVVCHMVISDVTDKQTFFVISWYCFHCFVDIIPWLLSLQSNGGGCNVVFTVLSVETCFSETHISKAVCMARDNKREEMICCMFFI